MVWYGRQTWLTAWGIAFVKKSSVSGYKKDLSEGGVRAGTWEVELSGAQAFVG